ncbi:MAG: hypothetical protein ABGW81_11020 [Paracoccaceae bacterium]
MRLYIETTYVGAAVGVLLMGQLYQGWGFLAVILMAAALNLVSMLLAFRDV